MELNIGGKTYKFKYTIEATLIDECVERTTDLMQQFNAASDTADVKDVVRSIAKISSTAFSMFYAGLLHFHGTGRNGDKRIKTIDDAMELAEIYFEENPDANWYDLLEKLIDQMGKDDFFKRIGLEEIGKRMSQEEQQTDEKPKRGGRKSTTA